MCVLLQREQTSWKLEACFKPMQNPLPFSHSKVCPRNVADTDESNLPEETILHDVAQSHDEHPLVCKPSGGGPPGGGEREALYSMEGENCTVAITTSVSPNSSYAATSYSAGTTGYLSVLYFNARSIIPKLDELHALIGKHTPELIRIIETWLHDSITDIEFGILNRRLIRLDRNRHGGGAHKPAL